MMIPPVASKAKKKTTEKKRSAALERISRFDLRPRQVREHLDRYVVRQDDAKKVLSVAICDHYNVVRRCLADAREREAEYSKPNILLLGPSGSGKRHVDPGFEPGGATSSTTGCGGSITGTAVWGSKGRSSPMSFGWDVTKTPSCLNEFQAICSMRVHWPLFMSSLDTSDRLMGWSDLWPAAWATTIA